MNLRRLAVMAPMHTSYARELFNGVTATTRPRRVMAVSVDNTLSSEQILRRGPWHGVLVMASNDQAVALAHDLLNADMRVVLCASNPLAETLAPAVTADPEHVATVLTQFAQRRGFKRIGMICQGQSQFQELLLKALAERGHNAPPLYWVNRALDVLPDQVKAWHKGLGHNSLTAVHGSALAIQIQSILRARGPAICGVGGDVTAGPLASPALTTLDLGFHQIGSRSAELLLARQWPPADQAFCPHVTLIERASTAQPNHLPSEIIAWAQRQFPKRPDIATCAEHFGMSKATLDRKLAATTSGSPGSVINQAWAALAEEALADGQSEAALWNAGRLSDRRALRRFLRRWSTAS